ncbi:MAG: hypothetical protein ACRD03_06210 [Acidimicrobiales bacterium]
MAALVLEVVEVGAEGFGDARPVEGRQRGEAFSLGAAQELPLLLIPLYAATAAFSRLRP